jgi:hypothetical protein
MLYAIATFLPPSGCQDILRIGIKNTAGKIILPAMLQRASTSPCDAPLRRARISEYSQSLSAGRLAAVVEELAVEVVLVNVDGGVLSQARVSNVS